MSEQLALSLPHRPAMGRSAFYVSEANAEAVHAIDAWQNWPYGKLLLTGPKGSGKTHLAQVFASQTDAVCRAAGALSDADITLAETARAVVVEDVETLAGAQGAQERLFHLHNALAQHNVPLLLTANGPATTLGLVLPDLVSRLQQCRAVALRAPDDALMAAVMVKIGQDRGISLPARLVSFALLRLERSFSAVQGFVAELDEMTLARGEKPGIRHAKAILEGPDA